MAPLSAAYTPGEVVASEKGFSCLDSGERLARRQTLGRLIDSMCIGRLIDSMCMTRGPNGASSILPKNDNAFDRTP